MSNAKHYVIGDLHGCYQSLQQLLDKIEFRIGIDYIYLLGDIVNRGPDSLACLRWAKDTPNVVSVLGNHDFHLLAVATGNYQYLSRSDSFQEILQAADKDELLTWLRQQPLLIHLEQWQTTLVHAGIPPAWSLKKAQKMANLVEKKLQAKRWVKFIRKQLYGNHPTKIDKTTTKTDKLRYAINSFTRMRLCRYNSRLTFKTPSATANAKVAPWFSWPRKDQSCGRIVFGHWSTLRVEPHQQPEQVLCLDSGCLWGGKLSALCLENNCITQVGCPVYAKARAL